MMYNTRTQYTIQLLVQALIVVKSDQEHQVITYTSKITKLQKFKLRMMVNFVWYFFNQYFTRISYKLRCLSLISILSINIWSYISYYYLSTTSASISNLINGQYNSDKNDNDKRIQNTLLFYDLTANGTTYNCSGGAALNLLYPCITPYLCP